MTFVCVSSLSLARGTFSLCWEDPLEKERATHSGILAWETPGQRSLADYGPWGGKESDTIQQLSAHAPFPGR